MESGRIESILADVRQCAMREAINKAQLFTSKQIYVTRSNKEVPATGTNLQAKMDAFARANTTVLQAQTQNLRGVPESVRIRHLQQQTKDAYVTNEYLGPLVRTVCPPIDTQFTNGNLPKPSDSCTSIALLNAGRP